MIVALSSFSVQVEFLGRLNCHLSSEKVEHVRLLVVYVNLDQGIDPSGRELPSLKLEIADIVVEFRHRTWIGCGQDQEEVSLQPWGDQVQ